MLRLHPLCESVTCKQKKIRDGRQDSGRAATRKWKSCQLSSDSSITSQRNINTINQISPTFQHHRNVNIVNKTTSTSTRCHQHYNIRRNQEYHYKTIIYHLNCLPQFVFTKLWFEFGISLMLDELLRATTTRSTL